MSGLFTGGAAAAGKTENQIPSAGHAITVTGAAASARVPDVFPGGIRLGVQFIEE